MLGTLKGVVVEKYISLFICLFFTSSIYTAKATIILKGHKLKELLAYYKKIWEQKLKNGGFKNYKTTIKYLELFLESKYASGDVYLSQVNGQFATDFEHYIRTIPIKEYDPCKGNGVGKHMQRFKRILNWTLITEN